MASQKNHHHLKSVKNESVENGAKYKTSKSEKHHEENKLNKKSQEINKTSKNKGPSFKPEVLEIETEKTVQFKESASRNAANKKIIPSAEGFKNLDIDDDWESIFNDSGDYLDPQINGLTTRVQKLSIEKTTVDNEVK